MIILIWITAGPILFVFAVTCLMFEVREDNSEEYLLTKN